MGRKAVDLTNRRFGRLVAKERVKSPKGDKKAYWLCEYECGNKVIVRKDSLEDKSTQSCGCYLKEMFQNGGGNIKHPKGTKRIAKILDGMKQRCYNPNTTGYENYGGRGITICPEWLGEDGVEKFIQWALKNGYKKELTIERINVNGNYEPSNCRWATDKEQAYSRRNTIRININGKYMTTAELMEIYDISKTTLNNRVRRYKHGEISVDELISKEKLKPKNNNKSH